MVGLSDPRLPLDHEVGGHTCRARPLILFNPSRPFARVFFLSCCLNAFSPTEIVTVQLENFLSHLRFFNMRSMM